MFKYILSILILFILIFGSVQLIGAERFKNDTLVDSNTAVSKNFFYPKESMPPEAKWQKYKPIKDKKLFTWLINEIIITKSWAYYKKTFISKDGRVIDYQRDSITTSEGQAYAMRRALLMNDKKTYDKVYNWTKTNLQHKHDKLFAWLWAKKTNNQGEIEYEISDHNGATDAGVEIAAVLIMASKVWNQKSYMDDALELINDIWNKESIGIKGVRILISGVNQNRTKNIEVNPSYFMPYPFKIFAKVDKNHDWLRVVDSSYRLTNWCINHIPSGLPPDQFYINRNTGVITFKEGRSDFSYDAVRIFYRSYIDYALTKDPRAEKLLLRAKFFMDRWKREGKFYTNYKQNGELKDYNEAIGSIAVILPVIKLYDKNIADDIYKKKILAKYHFKGYWEDPLNYYAQNLVWFGVWLYISEENVRSFKY